MGERPTKKKRTQKKAIAASQAYGCTLCPRAPDGFVGFETGKAKEVLDHFAKTHGVDRSKVRKHLIFHLNANDYFRSDYELRSEDQVIGALRTITPKSMVFR